MVLTLEEITLHAREITLHYVNAEQCRRQTEANLLRLGAFVEAFHGQTIAAVCRFQEHGLSYLELGEDRFLDEGEEVTYGDETVIAEPGNHCAHLYVGRIKEIVQRAYDPRITLVFEGNVISHESQLEYVKKEVSIRDFLLTSVYILSKGKVMPAKETGVYLAGGETVEELLHATGFVGSVPSELNDLYSCLCKQDEAMSKKAIEFFGLNS